MQANALQRSTNERQYFLDWLRITAFILLVLFHVAMYYATWDFHVKSAFAGPAIERWMMLSSPWRMSLLFLISGAASASMLRTKGLGLRERSRRLLLPLLAGMVLIVPPQTYFEVVEKFHYSDGYWSFLARYFSHYPGHNDPAFCQAGRCLIMPTWNHLWFLIYLWCYTALLILVLRWFPGFLLWGQAFLARVLQGPLLLVLPIALLWALRACLAARFPSTRALGDDWYNHAVYLSMFMAGTMLVQLGSNLFEAMQRLRWASLALAVLAWLALTNTQGMFAVVWRQGIFSVEHWCALVALIGFAHRHWQRDHPWRARLSEAVFPVYIFHQTFIVVLSQWFLPLKMQPKIEAPLLIASTLASSWIAYEMVRRWGVGRVWFGLGPCTQKRRHPSALLSA